MQIKAFIFIFFSEPVGIFVLCLLVQMRNIMKLNAARPVFQHDLAGLRHILMNKCRTENIESFKNSIYTFLESFPVKLSVDRKHRLFEVGS